MTDVDARMTKDAESTTAYQPPGRRSPRLRTCLAALACYLWLIAFLAVAGAGVHFLGWYFNTFRIDAVYDILCMHLCGAVALTTVMWVTRGASQVPAWSKTAVLATSPLILAISCDRLALLTYPSVPPDPSTPLFESHPARRWTLRPNAAAPSLGIKLNDRGMRGPLIPWDKAPGERRVLILGDSVAFGFGVADEQCFDRLAAKRLQQDGVEDITIVNLSVPGYAPWQQLDMLETEGMAYDPDVVIYAFCLNDVVAWIWRDVPLERLLPFRYEFLEMSGLARLIRGVQHDLQRWSTRSFQRERYALEPMLRDADDPGVDEAWGVLLEHVAKIVAFTRERDRRVAFLVFPIAKQLRPDTNEVRIAQDRLTKFAEANGILYLDLLAPFMSYCEMPGHTPGDLLIDGWHMSPLGHELTAAAFVDFSRRLSVPDSPSHRRPR